MSAIAAGPTNADQHVYAFEWDRVEFLRAHRQVTRYALYPRWLRAVGWLVLALLVGALGLGFLTASNRGPAVLVAMFPWLLLLACWFVLLRFGAGWLAARAWEKRHPVGERQVTYGLSASGLRAASYPGEQTLTWVAVKSVRETGDFFLFYITWQCAHYLPKRAVPLDRQEAVRALVREHMGVGRVSLGSSGPVAA